uniref:Uncharacterized protein n=1 Tax=Ixodes ricinus TaxID=34613 RepID=A0A147BF05_IXORI
MQFVHCSKLLLFPTLFGACLHLPLRARLSRCTRNVRTSCGIWCPFFSFFFYVWLECLVSSQFDIGIRPQGIAVE